MGTAVSFPATAAAALWMQGAAADGAAAQEPQHQRWTAEGKEEEEEDYIDPLVDQQGCGKVYARLETCLGENDRDWRRCQAEVVALKECYQKAQKAAPSSGG